MAKEVAPGIFYATGRRKNAVARVWLKEGKTGFQVNGRSFDDYVQRENLRALVRQPLEATKTEEKFLIEAKVSGGGTAGQAGAIRHGIARALVASDERLRSLLRKGGFLTRDPRKKERKKFGQKGARKRFQYTKR